MAMLDHRERERERERAIVREDRKTGKRKMNCHLGISKWAGFNF